MPGLCCWAPSRAGVTLSSTVHSLFVWPSRGTSLALPHFRSWRNYFLEKSSDVFLFFFFSFWADEFEERLIAFLTAPITNHFLPSASIQDDTNKLKKKLSFANLLLCFYATSNIQESSRSRELAQVLLCRGQKTSIRSGKGSCGCCCTLGSLTPPKEDEDPNLPVHTNTCIAAKLQPTLCLFAPSQAVALHKQ